MHCSYRNTFHLKTSFPTSGINGVLGAGGGGQGGAEAAAPAGAPGSKPRAGTAGGKRLEHHPPSQLTVSELLASHPSATAPTRCRARKKSPNPTSLPRIRLDTRSVDKHQPCLSLKVWQQAWRWAELLVSLSVSCETLRCSPTAALALPLPRFGSLCDAIGSLHRELNHPDSSLRLRFQTFTCSPPVQPLLKGL